MGNTPIAVTESITYNDLNVSKSENIFNDLLINVYIMEKSFDDDELLIPCNIKNYAPLLNAIFYYDMLQVSHLQL
ncbi:hypothetical protein ATN06_11260 [Bacillus thuringiensis]|nr:hypothetical protein ATN06_11260 [Bacillus thuringiensis]